MEWWRGGEGSEKEGRNGLVVKIERSSVEAGLHDW